MGLARRLACRLVGRDNFGNRLVGVVRGGLGLGRDFVSAMVVIAVMRMRLVPAVPGMRFVFGAVIGLAALE